ncbi:interleukin-1 receptor type 1 [Cololabis saira]|uniref:interleukin-1 receptor type 1 n=1 Tax=Cololabis saira TaxID=129043 RepID=UPI002AD43720|nr:interleukin-1 receptor type 1 [Cololabis saira]XP_061579087.1 interleukin-1 receptor type 1 [Cololabis saira]
MGSSSTLERLLFLLCLSEICSGTAEENCTNYNLQFERAFSVPGDMIMLNSTLVSPDVFNFSTVPYNITWYNSKTGREMSNQTGRILVLQETLWFLNVTLDDDGEYKTILRTPSQCYMQSTKLVVDLPDPGECGRPRKANQQLTNRAADTLNCPLHCYFEKLASYNIASTIKWYRGCDPVENHSDRYVFRDKRTKMTIGKVESGDGGLYTCRLTFTLGGVTGSVSETIDVAVTDKFFLAPRVHEPANEIVKAEMGSNFSKRCQVFVPGSGIPFVDVMWVVKDNFILETNASKRISTSTQRMRIQDSPKGVWLERLLRVSELREEDFNINYTCIAYSSRGSPSGYFTLIPTEPNIILPIGIVLGGVTFLFILTVSIYYIFRIEIVLWFRRAFPLLYANKDLDGKLYDAYVAYPEPYTSGFSKKVEKFALHELPQVLEKDCDYKLYIAGRDCLPGQAIVDSMEENIQASRRFLLLYTASTFTSRRHTSSSSSSNNNNVSKSSDGSDKDQSRATSLDGSDKVYPDTRHQLECVAAMHRALMDGSLKVVLVELEEITPAQLALFPASVRHLRKKQGAVCLWKNHKTKQRWRTCMTTRGDVESGSNDSQLSPSLSPSSRFWKEVRYHMPVRRKKITYPEKIALLNS